MNYIKWTIALFCMIAISSQAAMPVVTNVVASQRADTKLVDIYYDVFDDDGDTLITRVEISDTGGNYYLVPAYSFTGDIGEGVVTGALKHIVWDAGTDWDGEYSDEMRVKILASDTQGLPGLEWSREIPPGGFLMGQDGGVEGSGPSRHVNIPWSYWLSKYEITRQQYCDFLNAAYAAGTIYKDGTTKVYVKANAYAEVPNEEIIDIGDGEDIRWNIHRFEVTDSSQTNFPIKVNDWAGALAFARHYGYDLSTEAEWKKAHRGPDHDDAGEHLVYPWGNTIDGSNANYFNSGDPWEEDDTFSLTPVGYYNGNQIPFGLDMTNSYGMYDMAGNVAEYCRTHSVASSTIENYPQEESYIAATSYIYLGGGCRYTWSPGYRYLKCYIRDDSYGSYKGIRLIRRNIIRD